MRKFAPVLGVDLGGVVIRSAGGDGDTGLLGDEWLDTPAVDGCIDVLARLTAALFDRRVVIISKAGPKIQQRSREWLEHADFFARTGIGPTNLVFVRERRDKAGACRRWHVTHFVDDHVGVLQHLTTVPHRYLFTGGSGASTSPQQVPPGIEVADSWTTVEELLRRTVPN